MKYMFISRGPIRYVDCRDDLNARKVAEATDNISRVETLSGRVVWRRAETSRPKDMPTNLEGDLSDWLDRKK